MRSSKVEIERIDAEKLLASQSPDGVLLYLYLKCGNGLDTAEQDLHMSQSRIQCAGEILRQIGLFEEEKAPMVMGERPRYTEDDILNLQKDTDFISMRQEVERVLGKTLTTEELKILLGMIRYLGMSTDLVLQVVFYCRDKAKKKGRLRPPTLISIEKEAYAWAEQGIDTLEEAAAFIQKQKLMNTKLEKLKSILQIRGRSLTQAESKYANAWLEMGFREDALSLAYERTCLNTGGLSWAYMNKILQRWHQAGYHSAQQVQEGDKRTPPKGASGQLGQAELDAIARALKEG